MNTSRLGVAALLFTIATAAPASSQTKDAFVRALLDFTSAVEGTYGDEGPLLASSVEAMARGLAEWDAVLRKMEAGLASEIGAAPPPLAARMHGALGTAYLERGRLDDALRELDLAAKLDPRFAPAHLLRGLAFNATNRPREAAQEQKLAWRIDRDPVSAYRVARIELELNASRDAQEALADLGQAVQDASQRSGPKPPAFIGVGLFDEASVTTPVFARARYADAYALLQRAKYAEAIEAMRARIAEDSLTTDAAPHTPEVKKAIDALREGRAANAIAQLNAVAERWSGSSEFHRILGTAYRAVRDYEKAAEQLRIAIRLNRFDERSRLLLADVLAAAQDPKGASEALEEATRSLPQSGEAHWTLGRLRRALADERAALAAFENASSLVLFAGSAHLYAAIGRLYHNQLALDMAAMAYLRRIDAAPSDPVAHVELGDVYLAQDRLDAALAEFSIAALLDPTHARAFAGIGQIHAAAGRDNEAVRMLRRAVELSPTQLDARYALSRALMRLGQTDEAVQELRTFQQLQAQAMEEQRRRYQENLLKIEDALKESAGKGPGR